MQQRSQKKTRRTSQEIDLFLREGCPEKQVWSKHQDRYNNKAVALPLDLLHQEIRDHQHQLEHQQRDDQSLIVQLAFLHWVVLHLAFPTLTCPRPEVILMPIITIIIIIIIIATTTTLHHQTFLLLLLPIF